MLNKGIYEFEGGIGFKFGMYSAAVSEKEAGCSISSLLKKMATEGESTMAILQYFFGGAVAYRVYKKLDHSDITIDVVADWMETIGDEKVLEIFNESIGMPKNSPAPMTQTGQI